MEKTTGVKMLSEKDLAKYRAMMDQFRAEHEIEGPFHIHDETGVIVDRELTEAYAKVSASAGGAREIGDRHRRTIADAQARGKKLRDEAKLKRAASDARVKEIREKAEQSMLGGVGKDMRSRIMGGGFGQSADDIETLIASAAKEALRAEKDDGELIPGMKGITQDDEGISIHDDSEEAATKDLPPGHRWSEKDGRNSPGAGYRRGRRMKKREDDLAEKRKERGLDVDDEDKSEGEANGQPPAKPDDGHVAI